MGIEYFSTINEIKQGSDKTASRPFFSSSGFEKNTLFFYLSYIVADK